MDPLLMERPAAWSIIFFVILLVAIIFLPLVHPFYIRYTPIHCHKYFIWDSNYKKFLVGLFVSICYFIYLLNLSLSLALKMFLFSCHSFFALFALLFSLFVTCTGLPLLKLHSTNIESSTTVLTSLWIVLKNILFLILSIIICNCIGTLAASVLLFPSFLSLNSSRLSHLNTQRILIIAFIILIGNCGGLLSPLGDPPLYMGYINGLEFTFTFKYLYKIFLFSNVYILFVFGVIDFVNVRLYRRDTKKNRSYELVPYGQIPSERYDLSSSFRFQWNGIHHIFFLLLILSIIGLKGLNIPTKWPEYVQEIILCVNTLICICFDMIWTSQTPMQWLKKNYSTRIEPVTEVIIIFFGLLFTMSAPISLLASLNFKLGPKLLFLFSGVFASVLDNAPVYVSFAASAAAQYNITVDQSNNDGFLALFYAQHKNDAIETLRAISAGSVLMGGCTLLGNAPNMIVALMATRYVYRKQITLDTSENETDYATYNLENISFIRSLVTACLILIPNFIFIAFVLL